MSLALRMVEKLFAHSPPLSGSRLLDAGCGRGTFIEAAIAYAKKMGWALPEAVCVERDPVLAEIARRRLGGLARVITGDFLLMSARELGLFDYIISNPPYISYERIDPQLREEYKRLFRVAQGRFDVYMLFFERALSLLKPGGRLVFVTPEKYMYTLSASELRRLLAQHAVEEIEFVDERTFRGVLAYPAITVVRREAPSGPTLVRLRDGRELLVELPQDGSPWLAAIEGALAPQKCVRLGDLALRISAGVATGRDDVFVVPRDALPRGLERFAYPTISGGELAALRPGGEINYSRLRHVILVPYSRDGRLLGEDEARLLLEYLARHRRVLEERYAVRRGKP